MKLLSTSNGIYRYRLHGRIEELPLRPNHYCAQEGISSLSHPRVIGRGLRAITYVFKGDTWSGVYRKTPHGWTLVGSYTVGDIS